MAPLGRDLPSSPAISRHLPMCMQAMWEDGAAWKRTFLLSACVHPLPYIGDVGGWRRLEADLPRDIEGAECTRASTGVANVPVTSEANPEPEVRRGRCGTALSGSTWTFERAKVTGQGDRLRLEHRAASEVQLLITWFTWLLSTLFCEVYTLVTNRQGRRSVITKAFTPEAFTVRPR